MPTETIKCRECGSADVTEFKSGSYVCGHCEAIFKHVDPAGTVPQCRCGHYADGACPECGAPVCDNGYCSIKSTAGMLCRECWDDRFTPRCECGALAYGRNAPYGPYGCIGCRRPYCEEHGDRETNMCYTCVADMERMLNPSDAQCNALVASFVSQMAPHATLPIVDRSGGLRRVKHILAADTIEQIGTQLGQGWYVETPAHPGRSDHAGALGLAVSDGSRVWPALSPGERQIVTYGEELTGQLAALALHTHGKARHTAAEVCEQLALLLAAAVAKPIGPRRPMSKREQRRL